MALQHGYLLRLKELLLSKLLHFQCGHVSQLSQIKFPNDCLDGNHNHDSYVAKEDEPDKGNHAPAEQLFPFQSQTKWKQSEVLRNHLQAHFVKELHLPG